MLWSFRFLDAQMPWAFRFLAGGGGGGRADGRTGGLGGGQHSTLSPTVGGCWCKEEWTIAAGHSPLAILATLSKRVATMPAEKHGARFGEEIRPPSGVPSPVLYNLRDILCRTLVRSASAAVSPSLCV
eukprot:gene11720-biopygen16886